MTALRLAEHVAHTTDVDGMLDNMTPQQFMEWQAKDRVEPIGGRGAADILAMLAAVVANAVGVKSTSGDKLTPNDFAYWKDNPEPPAASADAVAFALQMIGASFGRVG